MTNVTTRGKPLYIDLLNLQNTIQLGSSFNNKKDEFNDPNPTNPNISRRLQFIKPLPKRHL